jgi:hypothetical protein
MKKMAILFILAVTILLVFISGCTNTTSSTQANDIAKLKVQNIWISPLVAYPMGPNGPKTTMVDAGICDASVIACPPSALEITSTGVVAENDFQWVVFPLAVPDGATIKGVKLYYSTNAVNPSSTYISQTRLTQMTTPNSALVMMDDATNQVGPGPTFYESTTSYQVAGANSLNLKVVIGNPADSIVIGGIEIFIEK